MIIIHNALSNLGVSSTISGSCYCLTICYFNPQYKLRSFRGKQLYYSDINWKTFHKYSSHKFIRSKMMYNNHFFPTYDKYGNYKKYRVYNMKKCRSTPKSYIREFEIEVK